MQNDTLREASENTPEGGVAEARVDKSGSAVEGVADEGSDAAGSAERDSGLEVKLGESNFLDTDPPGTTLSWGEVASNGSYMKYAKGEYGYIQEYGSTESDGLHTVRHTYSRDGTAVTTAWSLGEGGHGELVIDFRVDDVGAILKSFSPDVGEMIAMIFFQPEMLVAKQKNAAPDQWTRFGTDHQLADALPEAQADSDELSAPMPSGTARGEADGIYVSSDSYDTGGPDYGEAQGTSKASSHAEPSTAAYGTCGPDDDYFGNSDPDATLVAPASPTQPAATPYGVCGPDYVGADDTDTYIAPSAPEYSEHL